VGDSGCAEQVVYEAKVCHEVTCGKRIQGYTGFPVTHPATCICGTWSCVTLAPKVVVYRDYSDDRIVSARALLSSAD